MFSAASIETQGLMIVPVRTWCNFLKLYMWCLDELYYDLCTASLGPISWQKLCNLYNFKVEGSKFHTRLYERNRPLWAQSTTRNAYYQVQFL